jgi:membrane-associated phospholipid phosphatase
MHRIGILGHSLILLPASLGLIALLLWIGWRREAAVLVGVLLAGLIATLLAKLAFEGCAWGAGLDIESPSGHASFSVLVYGCLAVLVAAARPAGQRLLIAVGAAFLTLAIGFSRVAIRVHTPQEVICGLLIGTAGVVLFATLRGPPRRLDIPWRALTLASPLAIGLALCVALFARGWTPEPMIDSFARHVGAHFRLCV